MISPIQRIQHPLVSQKEVQLYIKRDDLIKGGAHGNKFRKLKHYVEKAKSCSNPVLLSFGGAFSNHLFAIAYAGYQCKLKTIGYVRGELDLANPTTQALLQWGMQLKPTDRTTYRSMQDPSALDSLQRENPEAIVIPEGGAGPLGIKGIQSLVDEVYQQSPTSFDYWVCPVGTGTTAAGLYLNLRRGEQLMAVSVLKGLDARLCIAKLLDKPIDEFGQELICLDAALGGFAKLSHRVEVLIHEFFNNYGILLDPIYGAKVMLKLLDCLEKDLFPKGSKILYLHTGGLQGNWGYNYRFGRKIPTPPAAHFNMPEDKA